jgi:hypothetical protein
MSTVTIPAHFHGPPGSGNGGYTCGVAALTLGADPARVRLFVPPPVDRELEVRRRGEDCVLLDDDSVVAEARPASLDLGPPEPVLYDEAVAALARFDVDAYAAQHAFPTCFTCGPGRAPGEGLRLFPAPVEGRRGLVASPWVPHESHAGADGGVRTEIVWAALDCPGGLVWILGDPPTGPAVLGELCASVLRRPAAGEELVAAGWLLDAEGRKRRSGTAVWTGDGELVAKARATWIVLSPEQHTDFAVRG